MSGRSTGAGGMVAALAALVVLAAPVVVAAQQGGAEGEAPRKSWSGDAMDAVGEAGTRDEVSGETVVVAAYGALWLILVAFVLRAQAQVGALRRESAELKAQLDSRIPEAGRTPPPAF